jgi:hypothetical protein
LCIGLLDLEHDALRGNAAGGQRFGDKIRKGRIGDCLPRDIHAEASNLRPGCEAIQHFAQHPAIELGHHAVMLERRKEIAGREQGRFLFAQPDEDLGHRVKHHAGERRDRLTIESELVLSECPAQV